MLIVATKNVGIFKAISLATIPLEHLRWKASVARIQRQKEVFDAASLVLSGAVIPGLGNFVEIRESVLLLPTFLGKFVKKS